MDAAPELQEAFAAMTPELWELVPLVLDPAHLDRSSSQRFSTGPRDPRGGRHESAGIDPAVGYAALPRALSVAAGTQAVAAPPSTDPPPGQRGGPQRKRRKRNLYSWYQRHLLESFFRRQNYPKQPETEMLAGMTGLTYQQIRIWFQNRRGKHRRLYTGYGTPESSLCTLQTQLCGDPRHDPFSLFPWPVLPGSPGPNPEMHWGLQGPVSPAFDSRIDMPPLQPPSTPTDFQAYNTWAPQTSAGTSPTAVHPVTINSSSFHFSQIQSMESLERPQLIRASDSLLSSYSVDSQGNLQWEPNHGEMLW